MEFLVRLMLIVLYALWLPAMLLRRALGGDPLQLKKPAASSYWLVRKSRSSRESYFSQESQCEGRMTHREGNESGLTVGRNSPSFLARLLKSMATFFARGTSVQPSNGASE